jgi:hypothetical protein
MSLSGNQTIAEVSLFQRCTASENGTKVQVLGLRRPVDRGFALNAYGWTVSPGKDGYYRLYETVEVKIESIYLGKRLDSEKAGRKIAKKERKLGLL